MLVFWYMVFFIPGTNFLGVLTFLVFFIAVIFGRRTVPKLIWPSCERDADSEIVRFCPECGSEELQKKGEGKYFLLWPRCRACGKELSRKRGGQRLYRISFC